MDPAVVQALVQAGIDPDVGRSFPTIGVERSEDGTIVPLGGDVLVLSGNHAVPVRLRGTAELCTGDAGAPSLAGALPRPYVPFFATIERTAADFCSITGDWVTDKEFERVYDLLARRPDGSDREPIFAVVQAAARLYLSLRDTSRAEFEALVRRLAKSARTFSEGHASRNYAERVLMPLLGR